MVLPTTLSQIYQRALLLTQLDASASIGAASGADLESVCLGWAQRTNMR